GKRFKSADKKICPYIPMTAEALFSLVSIPDFRQFTISNNWNRFDSLRNQGMQINYASFGIGAITYDQEEVHNYIIHQLIKKFILLKGDKFLISSDEPLHSPDASSSFTEEIEKPFLISERTDQSLTSRVLHASKQFGPISDRLDGFKKKVTGLSKTAELQQLKSQYKIPLKTTDNIDEWGVLFSNYGADIKKILFEKRIQLTQKLEEVVTRLVKGSSVHLATLTGWLDEALGVVEKNEEYILKHKNFPARNASIENIGKTWANLLKDKKLLGGIKVEYKIKLAAAVDAWIQSELGSLESPAIKEKYAALKAKILGWKTAVNILQDQVQGVRRGIDIQLGKYTSRDVAYNQDSLASNEFPLHVKLDINKDLVDTFILKERILDQKDLSRQLVGLDEMVYSGKGDLNGLAFYFTLISKEVFEGRERQVRGENSIGDGLYRLFFDIVESKVSSVLNEIRIDDILEYWLKYQLYPVAKRLHAENDAQALLDLKQRWIINFGESAADLLISPQFFRGEEQESEWFKAALKSFVYNFKGKIRAFVRYGTQIRSEYWEKIGLSQDSRTAFMDKLTIFVPASFRYSDILKESGEENILQIRSGFNKIKFFAETYAFPLHSLDLVKGYQEYQVREEYLKHRDSASMDIQRGAIPSLVRHIDKRFYTDWRIDIGSDEMTDVQGYWLYILGLGLGMIRRDDKKKFVLEMGEKKKTIEKTLPGALDKIRQDHHLRESLKTGVIGEVKSRYYSSGKDFAVIQDILRQAHKLHFEVQPPRTDATQDAYLSWAEIESLIKPLGDGSYSSSSRAPQNWNDMKGLIRSL
ncbi:MAG: hypothetical protein FJ088_04415, partial [Deltaproteobacteria bacterium]|nr:hypothetical protein [Deltaproteobacteria bacterium]